MPQRSDTVVRLIAVFKLVKGSLLIVAGIGAFFLTHGLDGELLRLQPGNAYLSHAITRVCALSPHTAELAGVALLLYAGLFLTEGIGLVRNKVWAEYLTTIITASFLPIEIYELVKHGRALQAVVLAVNIAIVIYLVLRLRHDERWPFQRESAWTRFTKLFR
ncbi:DUF2127 domain-containing protein [soil metagenome]